MSSLLALGRLLWVAEKAGPRFSGSIFVEGCDDGAPTGQIFIQNGRICWAIARGFTTRLLPLLAQEAGLEISALQQRMRQAALRGSSVEECLVHVEGLSQQQVRRAFLRHTAAIVALLASRIEGGDARIAAPVAEFLEGAVGSFSFSPLEIVAEAFVATPELSAPLPPIPREFMECAADHESALCLLETGDPFLPALPVASTGDFSGGLLASLDLLRQAQRFRRGLFVGDDRSSPFAGVLRAGDRGWAVTYQSPYFCVFRLSAAGEYGRVLTQYRLGRSPSRAC